LLTFVFAAKIFWMEKFVINGPCSLKGEIKVSGSKNAALPIIAATILAKGKYQITNVPMITDIEHLLKILEGIGAKTKFTNNTCEIDSTGINSYEPDAKMVRNIRASILLLGPLLARFKEVKIAQPGGCLIGARPIRTHLEALKELGARIIDSKDTYHLKAEKLIGKKIILDEISVTGTENLITAAVLAEGITEVRLAATEPHIVDLCNFLIKMGAKIEGVGSHNLVIHGKKELKPTNYSVIPDQIEAGTLAIAAVASRGQVRIVGFIEEHQEIFLKKLQEANVNFSLVGKDILEIGLSTNIKPVNIRTDIYPGFPTDLQAPFGVLMTQAEGTSTIYETLYEGRLNYLDELNKMGANCFHKGTHEATIMGPTPLHGTTIESFDLRAGATLLIASFIAQGESIIEKAEIIDRGYEKIDERLNALGANIRRVKEN
jgi:UDP-N-acetylglucosamine 1-carboxyvinyltransferase